LRAMLELARAERRLGARRALQQRVDHPVEALRVAPELKAPLERAEPEPGPACGGPSQQLAGTRVVALRGKARGELELEQRRQVRIRRRRQPGLHRAPRARLVTPAAAEQLEREQRGGVVGERI